MTLGEDAPAKLNLALHVRRRRADGYHDIETLFAFADYGDRLEGEVADTLSLNVDGPFAAAIEAGDDNLVLRAAEALRHEAGVHAGARLRLVKRLPVAAGLGGGSADAAAALRLLDRLWGLGWSRDRLAGLGARLGADVPACVHSRPMLGRGRGEELRPVALDGAAAILVNPRVALATATVFAAWDGIDRGALAGDWRAGRNDLEQPAIELQPVIATVLAAIAAEPGVTLARMSGSGATGFGVFESDSAAVAATAAIAAAYPRWWVVATRIAGG